jgi:hypothetical protein
MRIALGMSFACGLMLGERCGVLLSARCSTANNVHIGRLRTRRKLREIRWETKEYLVTDKDIEPSESRLVDFVQREHKEDRIK